MPCAEAEGVPLFFISLVGEDIVREESEAKISSGSIPIAIFRLNARLGSELHLHKGVTDVIVLSTVSSETVALKVKPAKAERCLLVNPGQDAFSSIRFVLAGKTARLKVNSVPVENGVELIERETSRTSGADKE